MSTIDNRVVEMNFDNSKFGSGVQGTLSMLERLKSALHLGGASQGLKDVNTAAQTFNSAPMEQGASRIAGSFTAMQAVAFGALANIGSKVASVAMNMVKGFTLEPLTAGFQEYELKMGSIQTILANTQKFGTTLPTVNKALEELNNYADQTIYNFGDMTKNIGLFTNAGIKVEDATTMIKGFSNAAAASGTNAEGAAGAAYQLSQALSAGKVTLMDWRSLQNVGMGNKNMQQGIIDIAEAMGTMESKGLSADKVQKDFNGSLEKGWLTADVMSTYMKAMSGDMDEAALSAIGLSDAQVKSLRLQATTGLDAATKVRTFTQLMSTLKEAVGSGWSESFGLIFGDFNEATNLFTAINNVLGGVVSRSSEARNKVLTDWKAAGGRSALIEGLAAAGKILGSVLTAVGTAFRNIFPAQSGKELATITKMFRNFIEDLVPSEETIIKLVQTFEGFFAILHIGWTIIKAVAGFLFKLFAGLEEGNKGILDTTASIGGFFVGLDKALSAGKGLTDFFDTLLKYIFKIINPIKDAGQAIGAFFKTFDFSVEGGAIGTFVNDLLSVNTTGKEVVSTWDKIKNGLDGIGTFFAKIARAVANFVKPVTDALSGALQNINFEDVNDALQTLSLGGIALFIKQLGGMFKGLQVFKGAGGGIMDKIKNGLDGLSGTLKAMQANLKASMLLKIAAAIALLAVSVVLLASVDAAGLARATAALTVMFIQLGAAMAVFQKIGSIASIAKLNLMGAALILLGVAILLLAAAVRVLAKLSWQELAKGLGALIVLMGVIIGLSKGLDRSRGAVLRSAAALVIMGLAIKLLVSSVKELGAMDLVEMAKGLGGVAALLISLALFTKLQKVSKGSLAQAVSLLALAFAIKILADAVKLFATMSWEELGKGFSGVAAGLILIGLALKFVPQGPQLILTALSIAKVAGALGLIALAFKAYNDIGWETIAKGVIAMGAALGILVFALNKMPSVNLLQSVSLLLIAAAIRILSESVKILGSLDLASLGKGIGGLAVLLTILTIAINKMEGSLAGAAALLIVAAALRVLMPVITTLGNMPIASIITALVALAAVFAILGVAGYLLAPVVPVLLALGIAIGLLGLALALAGAGVFLFATGLTLLAAAGAGATVAIVAIVSGLIGLIPMVLEQIGLGLVAFAGVIATAGPAITGALVAVLTALLDAIIIIIPKLLQTLGVMLTAFLKFLRDNVPKLIQAGFNLLIALLTGIARNIGRIVDKAADIIVNFVNGIARNLPKIIQAGINLIVAFLNGIGDGIRNNGEKIADAAWNMVTGIIEGVVNGLKSLGGKVLDAMWEMVKNAWNGVLDFFGIDSPSTEGHWLGQMVDQGIANGLTDYSHVAEKAAVDMGENVLDRMGKTIAGLGDMISGDVDMNPVITPVLDLSAIQKDSSQISQMLSSVKPINLVGAYSSAASAQAKYDENQLAVLEAAAASGGDNISFVQNNTSPKALSSAEIYRNTNSQLSRARARGALTSNAH